MNLKKLREQVLHPPGAAVPVLDDPVQHRGVGAGDPQGDDDAISMVSASSAMAPPEMWLRYNVATAWASTTFSPTRSLVRMVEGLLCVRVRSKNVSMLAVWPAVTSSAAP